MSEHEASVDSRKAFERHTLVANSKVVGRVFVTVTWTGRRLSITGVEGPKGDGDALGSCGQIVMGRQTAEERADYEPVEGIDLDKLFALWDRWHLNDMCAGSPRQEQFIREYKEAHPDWRYEYTKAKALLAEAGLEPAPDVLFEHKGYSYGTRWLFEEVPDDVLEFLRALPDDSHLMPSTWR